MRLAMFVCLCAVGAGLFGRGSVRNLIQLRFQSSWLLGAFLLASAGSRLIAAAALGLTLISIGAFVGFSARNMIVSGAMGLVAFGALLNFVVTADNGGMPFRPGAVAASGAISSKSADLVPKNTGDSHAERDSDQLVFASRILPIAPLREVVSVGDILVALGLGLVLFNGMSIPAGSAHSADLQIVRKASGPNPDRQIPKNPEVAQAAVRATTLSSHAAAKTLVNKAQTATKSRTNPMDPTDKQFDMFADHENVPVAESTQGSENELAKVRESSTGHTSEGAETKQAETKPPDMWDERVRLLKATGDIRVVVDLVASDQGGRFDGTEAASDNTGTETEQGELVSVGAAATSSSEIARLAVSRALMKVGLDPALGALSAPDHRHEAGPRLIRNDGS